MTRSADPRGAIDRLREAAEPMLNAAWLDWAERRKPTSASRARVSARMIPVVGRTNEAEPME